MQHQELPEAVGLRGHREAGVPAAQCGEPVVAHDRLDLLVVLGGFRREPVRAVDGVAVAVVGARDQRHPAMARRRGERAARPNVLVVRERAAGADDDRRRAHEPERDDGAPVERHRRRPRSGRAEGDPERRQPRLLQRLHARVGELGVAGPLVAGVGLGPLRRVALEARRANDREMAVDVDAVRRHDDHGLGPLGGEAMPELLQPLARRPVRLIEHRCAVRRDRGEDDQRPIVSAFNPGSRCARRRARRSARRRCRAPPSRSALRSARGRASRRSFGPSSARSCSRPR